MKQQQKHELKVVSTTKNVFNVTVLATLQEIAHFMDVKTAMVSKNFLQHMFVSNVDVKDM